MLISLTGGVRTHQVHPEGIKFLYTRRILAAQQRLSLFMGTVLHTRLVPLLTHMDSTQNAFKKRVQGNFLGSFRKMFRTKWANFIAS